ncbi:MAG TPA: phosphoribosylformylglycinamidine synthase subunit PurQ [Bdellovibrionales bacterium]|nr:phosphoribosylformylglycinamidine synthase subunit PurQ [Bdellovibrionales bacterium]
MKKVAVVRFPGTNCDRDVWKAVELAGHTPFWAWHEDRFSSSDVAGIVVPGGFSFGDYLRAGALASRSPVMESVREASKKGIPVLGICNGFQILCEAGLLPGALLKNKTLRFIDRWVTLKRENAEANWPAAETARLPVAHGMGRYYADADLVKKLWDKNQVWWTYEENPNGAVDDIAGITNEQGNVAALMPHPERAVEKWMGSADGLSFFKGGL